MAAAPPGRFETGGAGSPSRTPPAQMENQRGPAPPSTPWTFSDVPSQKEHAAHHRSPDEAQKMGGKGASAHEIGPDCHEKQAGKVIYHPGGQNAIKTILGPFQDKWRKRRRSGHSAKRGVRMGKEPRIRKKTHIQDCISWRPGGGAQKPKPPFLFFGCFLAKIPPGAGAKLAPLHSSKQGRSKGKARKPPDKT